MAYPCTSSFKVDWEVLQTRIKVRCRRCKNCLHARQFQWMVRAAREQMAAKRSWLVTLTFGPKSRHEILNAANAMSESKDQQDRLVQSAGWFVTNYIKRLRADGFRFRYVFIAEPHRDGFPHFHGIVHDQLGNTSMLPITKKDKKTGERRLAVVCPDLEKQFKNGFVDTELIRDLGAIRYVTKYIAKGRFGRIRASALYGAEDMKASDSVNVAIPPDCQQSLAEAGNGDANVSLREGEEAQLTNGEKNGIPSHL